MEADLEDANACNSELNLELEEMKGHCEDLQSATKAMQVAESHARHELEICVQNHQVEIDAMIRQAQEGAAKFTQTVSESVNQKVGALTDEIDELNQEIASMVLIRDERDSAVAQVAEFQRMITEEQRKSQRYLSQQASLQEKVALLTDEIDELHVQIASLSQDLETLMVSERKARVDHDSAVAAAADCKRLLLEEQKTCQVSAIAFA